MECVRRFIKITVVLIFVAFIFRFVYINIIPSPFRHELETCLENSQKLKDTLEIKIAKDPCLDIYPHFN
ncbi:MAG: hypothetical protein AAB475_01940 [Patescibacteria group bacterium]